MKEKSFEIICCYDKNTEDIKIDIVQVGENSIELLHDFEGEQAKLIYESLIEQNLIKRFTDEQM